MTNVSYTILITSLQFFIVNINSNYETELFDINPEDSCFRNPLINKGADPWIIEKDSTYYYCYSSSNNIFIRQLKNVFDIGEAEAVRVWTPPSGTDYSFEIWAPELHFIRNRWYIYFAADNGNNDNHKMYVLQSVTDDINNGFEFIGLLKTEYNRWAIDGTVLQYRNKLYFIWSGWEDTVNVSQQIYIQEMSSPVSIKENSKRTLLSYPEFDWEKQGGSPSVNEGPEILQSPDGNIFIVYSASGSWSDNYCLGMLKLTGDNPLNTASWKKFSKPVFEGDGTVISPGHCSFIKINGKDWMVYHAIKVKGGGWNNRYIRMQKFLWKNGEPAFGIPVHDGECINISE